MEEFEIKIRYDNEPNPRKTVYHAGKGFYNQYSEPLWKKEKRKLRSTGNGIGLATIFYVVLSLILGVFWMFVSEFAPFANVIGSTTQKAEIFEWGFLIITNTVSLLLPFFIYALCIGIPLRVAVPFRKSKIDLTFGGVLVGLGVVVLAMYATSYLELVLNSFGIVISMPEMPVPETPAGKFLYFILVTVCAAITEEIIFRGIILQSLRRFGDIFAIVVSALIFGFMHFNLVQMPYAFISGLCMGYFVLRTGSLWVSILIHFINNFAAILQEYLLTAVSEEMYLMINSLYNLLCVLLGIAAIIYLVMKYKDIFRFERSRSVLPAGKRALLFTTSPFLIIAMVIAALLGMEYIAFA